MPFDLERRVSESKAKTLSCPLCASVSNHVFERYNVWIADCSECSHRFADLAPTAEQISKTYGDEYFAGGGPGYDNYLDEETILRSAGRRYAGMAGGFTRPGTVLDVGAAAGFILKGFQDAGWTGAGVEINDRMARYGREQLGLDIYTGDLESYPATRQFDLVNIIQVMAHLRDPMTALAKVHDLIRPGGFLLIETWRRDSLTARMFGRNWHEYSPPSVLHWFTKDGLQRTVEGSGFRMVGSGRPSKWINAAHARSLIQYKLEQIPAGKIVARALDLTPSKLNLPYPAEDLVWMLFQKD